MARLPLNHALSQQADKYIEAWQARLQSEGETVPFGKLGFEAKFRLPGGLTRQTKLNAGQAHANGQIVRYRPWEEVVPV